MSQQATQSWEEWSPDRYKEEGFGRYKFSAGKIALAEEVIFSWPQFTELDDRAKRWNVVRLAMAQNSAENQLKFGDDWAGHTELLTHVHLGRMDPAITGLELILTTSGDGTFNSTFAHEFVAGTGEVVADKKE